jgi:hypothetical protein
MDNPEVRRIGTEWNASDGVNLLVAKINVIKKNTETLLECNRNAVLEIYAIITTRKYIYISCHRNIRTIVNMGSHLKHGNLVTFGNHIYVI